MTRATAAGAGNRRVFPASLRITSGALPRAAGPSCEDWCTSTKVLRQSPVTLQTRYHEQTARRYHEVWCGGAPPGPGLRWSGPRELNSGRRLPAVRSSTMTARRPSNRWGVGCLGSLDLRCVFRAIDKVSGGSRPPMVWMSPPTAFRRRAPARLAAQLKRPVTSIRYHLVRLLRRVTGRIDPGEADAYEEAARAAFRRAPCSTLPTSLRPDLPSQGAGRQVRKNIASGSVFRLDWRPCPSRVPPTRPGPSPPRRPTRSSRKSPGRTDSQPRIDCRAGNGDGPIPLLPTICSGPRRASRRSRTTSSMASSDGSRAIARCG